MHRSGGAGTRHVTRGRTCARGHTFWSPRSNRRHEGRNEGLSREASGRVQEEVSEPRVWLRRAATRDFRNLEKVDLDLAEAGIALIGENGHGKTNLLEAIYYLQILRSVRGARDQDLVRFGTAGFHIAAEMDTDRAREVG